MWRALVFIGLLCVAAFGAVWLADRPGTVLITFAGYEIQMSVAVPAIAPTGLPLFLGLPPRARPPPPRPAGAPRPRGLRGLPPGGGGGGGGAPHPRPPLCQRGR